MSIAGAVRTEERIKSPQSKTLIHKDYITLISCEAKTTAYTNISIIKYYKLSIYRYTCRDNIRPFRAELSAADFAVAAAEPHSSVVP